MGGEQTQWKGKVGVWLLVACQLLLITHRWSTIVCRWCYWGVVRGFGTDKGARGAVGDDEARSGRELLTVGVLHQLRAQGGGWRNIVPFLNLFVGTASKHCRGWGSAIRAA